MNFKQIYHIPQIVNLMSQNVNKMVFLILTKTEVIGYVINSPALGLYKKEPHMKLIRIAVKKSNV